MPDFDLMPIRERVFAATGKVDSTLLRTSLPNSDAAHRAATSEIGIRANPENQIANVFRKMWVDPDLRHSILDVREMDKLDPRVKQIHSRVARDTIRGGIVLQQATESKTIRKEWEAFARRLQLNRVQKLKSDAKGFVMEGNLPMQWVLDKGLNVVAGVRMPAETIVPNVNSHGRFEDLSKAYFQRDFYSGREVAVFPLWQMMLERLDPDNFDDMGSLGRPFLDASRTHWRKLTMTEEDLVIRRRVRAPLRLVHVLEGAGDTAMKDYQADVERDQDKITTDYYMNRKGGVTAIQGDASLGEIGDVVHLMDCFFAGTPIPKGLMGFTEGLARDILEDLKRNYYEEVDTLQDSLSFVYEHGFRLHLLLKGINPDTEDMAIGFAERRTETPNQTADRGLKLQALGIPPGMVWEEIGYDPAYVRERIEWEAKNTNPYPNPAAIGSAGGVQPAAPKVSITPGNARKGDSGTAISNA